MPAMLPCFPISIPAEDCEILRYTVREGDSKPYFPVMVEVTVALWHFDKSSFLPEELHGFQQLFAGFFIICGEAGYVMWQPIAFYRSIKLDYSLFTWFLSQKATSSVYLGDTSVRPVLAFHW